MASWVATENALREAGFSEKVDQVVEFIKTLPLVKSDYEILKDKVVADKNRLQEALGQKMPPVDKTAIRYYDFAPQR